MGSWVHLIEDAGRVTVEMGGNRIGKTLKALQAQAKTRAAGGRVVSLKDAEAYKSNDIPFDILNEIR